MANNVILQCVNILPEDSDSLSVWMDQLARLSWTTSESSNEKPCWPSVAASVQKFIRPSDRVLALASILLQNQVYRRVSRDHRPFILPRTPYRKPYIPSTMHPDEYPLSISHQYPYAASAFSSDNCLVGLDIVVLEEYNPKLYSSNTEFIKVFQSSFTAHEWERLEAMPEDDRWKEFYLQWAVKEAYTKAYGMGMGMEFSSFEIEMTDCTNLWPAVRQQSLSDPLKTTAQIKERYWNFFFWPLQVNGQIHACICLGVGHEERTDCTPSMEWINMSDLVQTTIDSSRI